MTILEIECFLSICEHKTISRAAEALYITQPSLSSRLKTLERELGGELFVRTRFLIILGIVDYIFGHIDKMLYLIGAEVRYIDKMP